MVLPRGRTDVHKMNADRHARGETGIDRADLGVDVGQERVSSPSSNRHDGRIRGSEEFEGHRS